MKIRIGAGIALIGILSLFSGTATAVPIVLDSSFQCSAGSQVNGIAIDDVTGNNGGATDCWGTLDGNDPGPSGEGFDIDGTIFDFIAKENMGPVTDPDHWEGVDIGLVTSPNDGSATSGTWAFDTAKFAPSEFLIVLKAANSPGYAAWLFTDGDSFGTWLVAWDQELSHIAIYATDGVTVPEPGMVGLLAIGLIGVVVARRKMKV